MGAQNSFPDHHPKHHKMNVLKTVFLTGVLAVSMASVAQADPLNPTVIRITGSTAFRSATHNAIKNILATGYTYAYTGAAIGSASQAIFTGTVNGEDVVIKTSWSGAVAGVQTVSQGISVNFLPDGTTQSTGGSGTTPAGTEAGIPDVGMADNYQASTAFTTPVLTDTVVGVVPFKWVVSNGAAATTISNITPQLAQVLFSTGKVALSTFTGLAADNGVNVFATGRDPDSGTRLTTFAESGIGVSSQVVQYQPVIMGTTIVSHIPWPVSVVNGITFAEGNGGYSSGGTLVTTMIKTTAALNGYYVSYLGLSDATNAIAGGAVELKYNGVSYSLTNIQEGLYTFWGYEHLMYKSTLATVKKTVANTLATQIKNVDSPILLSTMKVIRLTDGGAVTQNF